MKELTIQVRDEYVAGLTELALANFRTTAAQAASAIVDEVMSRQTSGGGGQKATTAPQRVRRQRGPKPSGSNGTVEHLDEISVP